MEQLANALFRLMTPEAKSEVEGDYARQFHTATSSQNLRMIPPFPAENTFPDLSDIDTSNLTGPTENLLKLINDSALTDLPFSPPRVLPCANVEVTKYTSCKNDGTMACSACKLVSYCSNECQKTHWRLHKQDCRNYIRSDNWKPAWVVERRPALFLTDDSMLEPSYVDQLSSGIHLWGNTPAMDVINLESNENNPEKDFCLAFVASGDLRHVLRTVNELPPNYSGTLKVLLNDHSPMITARNIALLLILGTIQDETMAAEIALHFWYSVFMPVQYKLQISSVLCTFLQHYISAEGKENMEKEKAFKLGPHAGLACVLSPHMPDFLKHIISSSLSMSEAQTEYDRVRMAPSRRDYRDRMYAQLRPSHRAAFQAFRRFGIVLPFGAVNAHFNTPNQSLFSPTGQWVQNDHVDPLEGWDIDRVIDAGRAHGAQPEDIYGCLYFLLSEQLRKFAQRLRIFKISFVLYPFDARKLSDGIREDVFAYHGIPSSTRFDRIFVSNILDLDYVGIRDVLTHWGPLLAEGSRAAIVGYFMNWIMVQKNGRAMGAGERVEKQLIKRMLDEGRAKLPFSGSQSTIDTPPSPSDLFGDIGTAIYVMCTKMDPLYDNSSAFTEFLQKQGLNSILRQTKLKMRKRHAIVPPRAGVLLHAPQNALPEFSSDESWYRQTQLSSWSWVERYVEFIRG